MDLFELLGKVTVDTGEAIKNLNKVSGEGEKSESKMGKAFSAIGQGAAKVGKAIGAGMLAAGTAVAGFVTKSIQSYAEYEQLVGGVDTLFKDSSAKVQQYAANAYKTAGMSANEYMETVTGFSASLLQSLEGDTEAAADKANMAITDMSDNANKMGTDISMIQNAYQGFAKQNYTMLDNLKLGYGGTQEEMKRLLNDAEAISGIKYNMSSYADVVDAIHVIQTEMGITGTTAKEASSTISGSISSMKGSWQNLLTAVSSDDLPFDEYVNNFVDSVSTVLSNLMPRIQVALGGVVELINQLAPVIIGAIPGLLSQLLPAIITAATGLIDAIVGVIPDLVQAIVDSLPQFIDGFVQIFNGIVTALPTIMQALISALPTLLPLIIDALVSILLTICETLPQIIQPIIDYLPDIIISVIDALMNNLPALIQGLITLVIALVNALPQIILSLVNAMPTVIKSLVNGLKNAAPVLIQGMKDIWNSVTNAVSTVFNKLKEKVVEIAGKIKDKIAEKFNAMKTKVSDIFNNIKTKIANTVEGIKSKVTSVFNKVKEAMEKPIQKARDTIKGIVDKIKGFFSGLKLKFPNIKLPHFSLSPSGWKIGDLLKGSIPKLAIDWYAKAMDKPILMDKPTLFGYDPATGQLMGGGEAGSEVVSGTNTLMAMIQGAVAAQNSATEERLDRIINLLVQFFPAVLEQDLGFYVDSRQLATAIGPAMNEELGKISIRKGRGR